MQSVKRPGESQLALDGKKDLGILRQDLDTEEEPTVMSLADQGVY